MSRRVEIVLMLLVLAGALALRVVDLRGAPPGAQHDEVFSANFATQIINGARPVYWDQNGGIPVFHSYLVALAFALFGTPNSIVVTLRMVSVVCGLATIVFTYLAARPLFGAGVALFAAALMGASQWHLFESRVGLEPITVMMMASVTAWGGVRLYVQRRPDMHGGAERAAVLPHTSAENAEQADPLPVGEGGRAGQRSGIGIAQRLQTMWREMPGDVLTGIALGLTMYTYQPGPLVGLALAAFAGYLLIWQRAQFRAQWRSLARLFVVAALVTAPLPIHFLTTEGDASSRLDDLAADLKGAAAGDLGPLAGDAAGVLGMLAFSGDPSFRYNLPGRPVFTPVVGLLAYAGLLLSIWKWREPRYAFVVLWIGCTVLASAVTRASPSFLRSSAALPMIAMLPGIAISDFVRRRSSATDAMRNAQFAFVAFVLVLIAWETASTTHDYFTAWAGLERVRTTYRADMAELAAFLDAQQPAGTVMLSARFPSDLDQGALYLQQQRKQNYQWFNGRRVLVLPNDRSGQGVSYFIPATNASLGDGAALLQTLEAHPGPPDEQGKPAFTLYRLPPEGLAQLRARAPQMPLRANVGNEVELIGLDTSAGARSLHVLLVWQVVHRVPGDKDRSFFTHLVDANGKLWTQEDRSAYPTSSWQDGDVVWQWYDLQLPAEAPAGDYWVELGVYDANAPGQPRVPIIGADGKMVDDHVRAGPMLVASR